MRLRTYTYEVDKLFEATFNHAVFIRDEEIMRQVAPLLLRSIRVGKSKAKIIDEDTVKLWEERSAVWLEKGRQHGY